LRSGRPVPITIAALVGGAFLIHAELEPWVQHTPSGPAIAALFRSVAMPGGAVSIRKPPAESRPALTSLISAAPRDAMLYRLRAHEAELALDFAAAEADWKNYAQNSADQYGAQIELADFYHRRIRTKDELAALKAATVVKDDPLQPAAAQKAWSAFGRMAALVQQETGAEPIYRAWVNRYPKEAEAWRKLIEYLSESQRFAAAEAEIANYRRVFQDDLEPVRMLANLEMSRGSADAALLVYDRAFEPLWPDEMLASYFKLLEQQGQLRDFAGRARTALASNPSDLNATARLFHYFKSQNNIPAARRALLGYRIAKESGQQPWTAGELLTTAQLFERIPDVIEAARLYYALYSVPGGQAERALDGLANLLLTAPEQPIQFGSGDLSFYKDIVTIDPSPGFLNGILSLVLNSAGPRWEYQGQNEKSTAYFHRAAAGQLVILLEQRFPRSVYRAPLRAKLIAAYGVYGDDAAVIRAGREYLAAFSSGADRVSVAMHVSDALARANRGAEELALYDQLLRELAGKASGVPIGSPSAARSVEYVQVLDKYISRLAALNRRLEAIRVYRTEIDRNPDDPGLYERLGAFLEQNAMSRDVEDIYGKAIAKFSDRSWYHKLARWYLRNRERGALEKISRDAVNAFSGSELESYFVDIVSDTNPDAALYLQLNLYAHERFPEDLVFIYNLMSAYARPGTSNAAAAEHLLRQYWFYDARLRSMLFERLSQQGRLVSELAEIRKTDPGIANGQFERALATNPAAVQFAVEAEAWLSHFEAAAPGARSLATAYPGRRDFTTKASALYRSLAAFDKRDTEIAATLAGYEQQANPRDPNILARIGDIFADRELFARAHAFWERMPAVQPGNPEGFLDAATVYWDYYKFNDALRLIATARRKFEDPALFAYQAGAIYEGRRDDRRAAQEYLAGALDGQESASARLLRLSIRPRTRDLIDRATAAAVAKEPSREAVSLRISVLESQQRRQDIETLLRRSVEAEKASAGLIEWQEIARRLGFDAVEERASERLAVLTNDPVDKMRLVLSNARLLESKKDVAGAARVVDALYRDHPLILGVVRGAVDLHVRNRQPGEAIDILLDAAKRARADLAAQFTLESARIATGAGQFDRARILLKTLLTANPFHAGYLAAMADTYLQAKDDSGFRQYQLATIQGLRQSPLTREERIERIATLRRTLIPALDRLKDTAGAVDQYIEVINGYPEDEALTKEAAAYAMAHSQAARLLAFYRKTVSDAPLDYRWPIVLGRIETVMEDFPAAIADYERAIKARPDRADVLEAKARLEERLARFEDSIKSYGRLYELSYRNPEWLIKVAELHARLGQTAEAVNALKSAIIGQRTETADADFEIAEQLEAWHILPDAVAFADRGAKVQGADLFNSGSNAQIYTRIMVRARRTDAVLSRLDGKPASDQVRPTAGQLIEDTYTPEEKVRFEQALSARAATLAPLNRDAALMALVESANLTELESRWRIESMMLPAGQVDSRLIALQSQRGRYAELGRQLEDYAAKHPGRSVEGTALIQAAQAFISDGDVDSQMRVLGKALERNALSGALLDRYLALLVARRPNDLLTIVGSNASSDIRNRAVQSAIASDRQELAYSAVRTRGNALPPVWSSAYLALTGLYMDDRSAAIDSAFRTALDTRTIGERLKVQLKPDAVVVGSMWFYYGSRYGDYLAAGKNAAADAWLPAAIEAAPSNPDAYMRLGRDYADAGQHAKSIDLFERALQLDPDRADAHDLIACALWSEGRRAEAVARWKIALSVFVRIQSRGVKVPDQFWSRAAQTFAAIGERRAMGEMRGDIARQLGDYYQRNGQYRFSELIEPAVRASIASGEGIDWLVELGRSTGNPGPILFELLRAPGVTETQRIALQRENVNLLSKHARAMAGDEGEYGESLETGARLQLVAMLLHSGDAQGASKEWNLASAVRSRWDNRLRDELEIRLASKSRRLDSLLGRYLSQPQTAPSMEDLRNGALALRRDGDEEGARSVLEFLYDREIRSGHLDPSNFIGLAEVKLERNDTATALGLLSRMTLVADDGLDTLLPAAGLLEKYGRSSEAGRFIRRRVQAVPWDSTAKVQLARTLPVDSTERGQLLMAAVNDTFAPYKLRAEAARLSAPHPAGADASELALLSSTRITAGNARKPYQVEARIDAARASTDMVAAFQLWQEALAIAPFDERARAGTLRAAIALRRDSLALALDQGRGQPQFGFNSEFRYYGRRSGYAGYVRPQAPPNLQLSDPERAAIEESLSGAAERLGELDVAEAHLLAAIRLRPADERDALMARWNVLAAERRRREQNAVRQPAVKDGIDQDRVVRPRILRGVL